MEKRTHLATIQAVQAVHAMMAIVGPKSATVFLALRERRLEVRRPARVSAPQQVATAIITESSAAGAATDASKSSPVIDLPASATKIVAMRPEKISSVKRLRWRSTRLEVFHMSKQQPPRKM